MKNIIVGILTLLIVGLMAMTAMRGGAFQGAEAGNIIEDIEGRSAALSQESAPATKDNRDIEQDKLKALREKAGNVGGFKVSHEYKSKCASCHGMNGEGIIGPKLIGLSSEVVYQHLIDYKSGRKENMVMKGLLMHLEEADLKRFAEEIGEFESRAAAAAAQ